MSNRHFSNRYDGPKRRNRAKRAKTFKTEDGAKKYAEAKGIKSYDIVNIRVSESSTPKLKVIPK